MLKKKVLWVGESSFMMTGYATIAREIIPRLCQKYEIAEFGCYGYANDPRRIGPWKFYGNMPNDNDEEGRRVYQSDGRNAFGKWRFEEVLLDFRPDVVLGLTDVWMFDYALNSPLRHNYGVVYSPTVDSIPINPEWIAEYAKADVVLSYTKWGLDKLKEAGGDLLNLGGVVNTAVDTNSFFHISDRAAHKEKLGLPKDSIVIGMVARNQKRKLFSRLFAAFRRLLDELEKRDKKETADKCYLYLHTSYPDNGWWLPTLLKEYNLSSKVLFTYVCPNAPQNGLNGCGGFFPSFFTEAKQPCHCCFKSAAIFPNPTLGLSNGQLNAVYNLFDCYVQYSAAESPGMPTSESAFTGCAVYGTGYSGVGDVLEHIGGVQLRVGDVYRETETHRYFALPDNGHFVEEMIRFLSLPEVIRKGIGMKIMNKARAYYSWDKSAEVWSAAIDSLPKANWDQPARLFNPSSQIPAQCSNSEFIRYCCNNLLGIPERCDEYSCLKVLRDINNGSSVEFAGGPYISDQSLQGLVGGGAKPFGRNEVIQHMLKERELINYWEGRRVGKVKANVPDFVRLA